MPDNLDSLRQAIVSHALASRIGGDALEVARLTGEIHAANRIIADQVARIEALEAAAKAADEAERPADTEPS